MQNILFLVHVEETFRRCFPPMYVQRLRKAVTCNKYDQIIHLTSHINDDNPIPELIGMVDSWNSKWSKLNREIDWAWGYDKYLFEDQPEELKWVIPTSSPHQTTWVPPELRSFDWKNAKVFVGGGADGVCLQGFEDVLTYLGVEYKKIHGYVYSD